MWPLRTAFLLLCCPGFWCLDCNKTKLYFVSQNFFSVLRWDDVHMPGQEVLYSVQYKKYGSSVWDPIMGCRNISVAFCDLSSVLKKNVYERYYARVMVNSVCVGEYMDFIPLQQTVLGAPEVSVTVSDSSLTVIITTPTAPFNQTITQISQDHSGKPHINYEVQLNNHTIHRFQNSSGVITVSGLELNTEYCGTAFYLWTHPSNLRQSEKTPFCATIPEKPWMHIFILPGLLALFLMITLALVLCQRYVMRKQRLPDMLKKMIPKSETPPYYTDLKVKIDIARIYSESPWTPWKFDKPHPGVFPVVERPIVGSNGSSYAAQDCGGLPSEGNSYANQHVALVENHDPSNESSTSYGMVVPEDVVESLDSPNSSELGDSISSDVLAPVSFRSGRCGEPLQYLNRSPGMDKKGSVINKDLTNEAIVLPVLRGEGGKLEFSFFGTSTLPANISEVQQVASGLAPAGERTLLLADLVTEDETESSDSGFASDYGRAYISNYVQQNFTETPCTDANPLASLSDCTSNYRQNWVPGIPLDSHLSDNDCITDTKQLTELDEEEDDGEDNDEEDPLSRLGAIVLDGWVVQIQT